LSRFESRRTPGVYAAVMLTLVGIFVGDVITQLGMAVWVLYLIPSTLTLFSWQSRLPLYTAAMATALSVAGFLLSPSGVAPEVALTNRFIGATTVWAIAAICFQFIRIKVQVEEQEWLQSGQTGISEQVAGEPTRRELADRVVGFLASYLQAPVGALYIVEGGRLRRAGSYALPATAEPAEWIAPGEGLVGQAYCDERVVSVRHLPEGYLPVTSSLGRATPHHVVVAPVVVDDQVQGVLELGFLREAPPSDLKLLERIGESVAIGIRSALLREQLQNLLEESQTQNEELKVLNEELEEQRNALRDNQGRLEEQQAELEQTNAQLEEQATRLESQREDLERSALQLEQASRYKSDFLANISHELRTPLNSTLILAKILSENREETLTPEQVRYAESIHQAGNDLLLLINDILDLSKIEAGHIDVKPERVSVARIVSNLHRTFEPMARQKGLEIRVEVPEGLDEIETDPHRLEQVLRNLLSNAVKFTEQGHVALEAHEAGFGFVEFAVSDTGIGIAEEEIEGVFEAFRQANGSTSRKYGGTGLGLSISRNLARLLGGELEVESEVGEGSTFTVSLPREFRMERPAPSAPPEPKRSPRTRRLKSRAQPPASTTPAVADDRDRLDGSGRVILVIEDDLPFARILLDLAHEMQFQCLVASTAEEGMELADRCRPSAIVLDMHLPDVTGLSVLDRIKADRRTRHIPVHVISVGDYMQKALSMGAAGYMLKPVPRDELVQAFEGLARRLDQKMRRVLLVEDDPTQLEALRKLLETHAVTSEGASTAAECLERLRSTTFDCMVLDLSLPDGSGFGLLETLSREERYSFPPVIVYTGRDLSPSEESQLLRYSRSIIIKGAKSPERLLDEVTLFLHQVVADLPPEQQKILDRLRHRDEALEGKRILVVEDDVRNVFALSSVLEPKGAVIEIARNGLEAIECLEGLTDSHGPSIDLVLMDLMMPEMDGLTAIAEIRKRPEWERLPIIALTAKAMKDDQERCLAAGANDYMSKPIDVDRLLSLIRVWIRR
jgi:signal transduction histidine kinase/DNA-binding response OmpR family regulator